MKPTAPEYVVLLVDVSALPAEALEELTETAFAGVTAEVRNPSSEPCAGFTSALV
ncbi:FXSXX-COOH protein [Streptomyces ossamyceticus]|jgi:hypothetical protein|uniref:FXSXX-COOH protein n=1 Tax=Streptomyces ossamyceticus TaxID=249581 RepID=UPI001F0AA6E5|nr:FXSXX-COOH protein [Streptomyces ossamyceticus]